jgi:hypothetical protein
MWQSPAAFWRDFSKQRWESALFADSTGAAFPSGQTMFVLPTDFTEDPFVFARLVWWEKKVDYWRFAIGDFLFLLNTIRDK